MAEKSYYLEKAKLEKEGLDPVSHLSDSSLPREESAYLFKQCCVWESRLTVDSSLYFCIFVKN